MMIRIFASILILLVCGNLIAQPNYTGLITDPQIGPDANAEKLIEVVDDINKRENISNVVVMGNITATGKFDEFLWAQEILDGLAAPYFVVGGEKDYLLSEGKGNEISLLWGDDKFWMENSPSLHIGFNTIIPKYKQEDYFDIETRDFLWGNFSNVAGMITFIYTYNDIHKNKILQDLPLGVQPIFITGKGNKKLRDNSLFTGSYLNSGKEWTYNLLETKIDSIRIVKISKSKLREQVIRSFAKAELEFNIPVSKTNKRLSLYPHLYKTELRTTVFTSPIINVDETYIATKGGIVIRLNKNGANSWSFKTNGTIYSSPKIEKDLVVVATNEGDLFTINKNTGNLFQVIGIGETITSNIALVDIEHNGMKTKGICFGTAEGNFYFYELYSLELIWWNNGVKEMINSSVATVKGKVIFQDKKGTTYCLNSRSGVLLWKWKANTKIFNPLFKSDLIVSNNNVYFIDFDGDLHCIDALLGTKKWSIRKIKATGKIELNEKRNEIILHSAKNKILVVSPVKRKVTEEIILPVKTKDEIATDIEIVGEKLMAGFTNGSVYQFADKQLPKRILWQNEAPIVSIDEINGNILLTDYDGNLTLLDLQKEKNE